MSESKYIVFKNGLPSASLLQLSTIPMPAIREKIINVKIKTKIVRLKCFFIKNHLCKTIFYKGEDIICVFPPESLPIYHKAHFQDDLRDLLPT